jgi:hypothetical protein
MQAAHFTDEASLAADATETKPTLRVVIAYDAVAAGQRALRMVTHLAKRQGDDIEFELLPWSFDLLAEAGWQAVASNDVATSDILVLATHGPHPLPSRVGQWAEDAIRRKHGTATAVVALFGPEENPDGAGSVRLRAMQQVVREAGLDFFAPSPRHELNDTIANIHRRAELITPVIEGILRHPLPAPRLPLGT